jgi:hypothetical protein
MVTAAGYRSGPQVVIFPGLLLLAVAHDHVITTPGGRRRAGALAGKLPNSAGIKIRKDLGKAAIDLCFDRY